MQSGGEYQIYKSLPKQTFKGSSYFHSHLPGCQVWPIPETFRGNVEKIGYFFGFSHFWLRIQLFFGLLSQLSLAHLLSSFQHFSHYFFFLVVYVFFFFFYNPLTVLL